MNRSLHVSLAAALFCAACLSSVAVAETNDRPNVVLIMTDDQGWGDVGYHGHKTLKTPHLDAMAAAGLRFNRFYAASAVCSPTRGSCLTGRHPYRYGVFHANTGHMRTQEVTLPELLREAGYVTGHFGKWHLGTLTKTERDSNRGGPGNAKHYSPPDLHGYDTYFVTEAKVPTYDPMLRPAGVKGGTWWDPAKDRAAATPYGTAYWQDGKKVKGDLSGCDSRVIVDRAVPFIRGAVKQRKPFFAVVWFHAPHLPVVAGAEHTKYYKGQSGYAKHYFGCITALDEQVGRLRKELKTLGVADNTMVWFCADNGPEGRAGSAPGTAGRLRGRKRDLFEGGVRVPGILEWPARVKAGSVTDVPAVTSDYLPTVLDVLGLKMPDNRPLDGVSLLPLIEGRMKERPSPIAFEFTGKVALTDNRFKLISQGAKRGGGKGKAKGKKKADDAKSAGKTSYMLFDIVADPGEQNDVSAKHPDVVKQMAAKLDAWRQSHRDSLAGKDYTSTSK